MIDTNVMTEYFLSFFVCFLSHIWKVCKTISVQYFFWLGRLPGSFWLILNHLIVFFPLVDLNLKKLTCIFSLRKHFVCQFEWSSLIKMLSLNKVTVFLPVVKDTMNKNRCPLGSRSYLGGLNRFPQGLLYCHLTSLSFPFDGTKQNCYGIISGMLNLRLT